MKAISYNLSIERSSDEILISQVFGDEYSVVRITPSMINLVCEQLQALKQTKEFNLPFQRESSAKEKGFPSFDEMQPVQCTVDDPNSLILGEFIQLTEDLIRQGMTNGIGINKKQQEVLGIKSLHKGWMQELIGKVIHISKYNEFLELKGATSR